MRTLHVGLRVSDLQRSRAFYGDPDGYRIELVQWPAGHADGITKADLT
jgi:hypothetical protein